MRFDKINSRSIAQRARRDAEREAKPRTGPLSIPHGTPIGRIVVELHGQRVEAVLLQAGERCRTHGVSIDGAPPELLGLYQAAARVTAKIARVPSRRSDLWRDEC